MERLRGDGVSKAAHQDRRYLVSVTWTHHQKCLQPSRQIHGNWTSQSPTLFKWELLWLVDQLWPIYWSIIITCTTGFSVFFLLSTVKYFQPLLKWLAIYFSHKQTPLQCLTWGYGHNDRDIHFYSNWHVCVYDGIWQMCCRVIEALRTVKRSLFCICFLMYYDMILYPALPSNTNINQE